MIDLATIRAMAREQAAVAARKRLVPFIVEAEDLADWKATVDAGRFPRIPFPNIGSFEPKGWTKGENLFVDKTGMGLESEPALTIRGLIHSLEVGKGYAITEEGQFQVHITEFDPPKRFHRAKDNAFLKSCGIQPLRRGRRISRKSAVVRKEKLKELVLSILPEPPKDNSSENIVGGAA